MNDLLESRCHRCYRSRGTCWSCLKVLPPQKMHREEHSTCLSRPEQRFVSKRNISVSNDGWTQEQIHLNLKLKRDEQIEGDKTHSSNPTMCLAKLENTNPSKTFPKSLPENCRIDNDTGDGSNPAPVDMVNVPLFSGFYRSQAVQDFFHQQSHLTSCHVELNKGNLRLSPLVAGTFTSKHKLWTGVILFL